MVRARILTGGKYEVDNSVERRAHCCENSTIPRLKTDVIERVCTVDTSALIGRLTFCQVNDYGLIAGFLVVWMSHQVPRATQDASTITMLAGMLVALLVQPFEPT